VSCTSGAQGLLVAAVLAHAGGIAVADPIPDSTPMIDPSPASLPSGPVIPAPEPAPVPAAERPPSDGMRLSPRVDAVLVSYMTTLSGDVATRDVIAKAAAPLVRGHGYGFALLGGYASTHLDTRMSEGDAHLRVHRFEATLGGGGGLAPGWSLRGSFGVAHASDLEEFRWNSLQVTASGSVHHVLGPSDAVVVGLVYTSTAEFFPVLPLLGYVHQREGSPFRLDVFLPHHARVQYALAHRVRGALGIEALGTTWNIHTGRGTLDAKRGAGATFAEIELGVTPLIYLQARAGVLVAKYTLPAEQAGVTLEQGLRAAGFAQLAVVLAP